MTAKRAKAAGKRGPKPRTPGGAPRLGGTLASVAKVNRWLVGGIADGTVSSTVAREMSTALRTAIMEIRTREGLHEMDELRKLVERQEQAIRKRRAIEVEAQHSQHDDDPDRGLLAEWTIGETGELVAVTPEQLAARRKGKQ